MKKIVKNIVWIALAVVLAGCEIGDGEMQKTKTGKLMYDAWSEDMAALFNKIIEPTFNFNRWLTASEAERSDILEECFEKGTTITSIGDQRWKIQSSKEKDILYMVFLAGQSLYDENCQINVFYATNEEYDPIMTSRFIISKEEGNTWTVRKEGDALRAFKLSWPQSAGNIRSVNGTTFSIQGNGMFTHYSRHWENIGEESIPVSTPTDLFFDIVEPVVCTLEESDWMWSWPCRMQEASWQSGKFSLRAEDRDGNYNVANIIILDEDKINVEIGGVGQTWEF